METRKKTTAGVPPAQSAPVTDEHWQVLLAEFVHLLGLLLIHSRHAKSVKATAVLYEQMLHHLALLQKMPDHEGTMMLNCSRSQKSSKTQWINYRVLFGNLILQRSECKSEASPLAGKQAIYLNKALDQTFEYLLNYGIQSLYLQLPGASGEKIDQFHLALNIVARFQDAVKHRGAVTFHFGGRAVAIPLVCDPPDHPDFNLTLLAGINGLSAANANELIKQAKAFHDLALTSDIERKQKYRVVKESYNQIFKVRSLRSQIIKPPVEVNNIPWICEPIGVGEIADPETTPQDPIEEPIADDPTPPLVEERTHTMLHTGVTEAMDLPETAPTRKDIEGVVGGDDPLLQTALDKVVIDDYAPLETSAVGERLVAVTRLLFAIEKASQDPAVIDRLLYFLQGRLLQVSDQVLSNIEVQRQGLKFISKGRTMVVGMMHPRLMDMINLVKDQVITRHKIDVIQKVAFEFNHEHTESVVKRFDISVAHAHRMLDLFKACFDEDGRFIRDAFEGRIDEMARQADAFFEINWCFLKETPQREDRLAFLNAIQLLMARLEDPKRALKFLLDDVCQHTAQINYTDRNALVLANVLMQAKNKTLHVDLERTPKDFLLSAGEIQGEVKRYAIWRINTDNIRFLEKVKTIHQALNQALSNAVQDTSGPVDFLLALEREAMIFLALVNGTTARNILRTVLNTYGNHQATIYQHASSTERIAKLMAQLHVVVQCMGLVGYKEDIRLLKKVAQSADGFSDMDSRPAHLDQIKLILKQLAKSIKLIQSQNR